MRIQKMALVAVVGVVVLGIAVSWLRSSPPLAPVRPRPRLPDSPASPASPISPVGTPSTGSAPPLSLPPASKKLSDQAFSWREAALEDVKSLLRTRGGSTALERIAAIARRKPATTQERFMSAYYTRLIPFVASEDPSALSAGRSLALEILRLPESDVWTRFQALAGIGGVASTRLTTMSVGEVNDATFIFNPEPDYPFAKTEWERGPLPSTDLSTMLPALLARDPEAPVRELAAVLSGREGARGALAGLEHALQTDSDEFVREACLKELAQHGPSALPALRRAATEDSEPDVRTAAIRAIAKAAPNDPGQAAFHAQVTLDPHFTAMRDVLAETAFGYTSPEAAAFLRPALLGLLTRNAGEVKLVSVFVEQAGDRGLSEYQALFRTLASGVSPEIREIYERGIRKLDDASRSVELAQNIKAGEKELLGLWEERNRQNTSEARKDEIDVAINRKITEIASKREESRR